MIDFSNTRIMNREDKEKMEVAISSSIEWWRKFSEGRIDHEGTCAICQEIRRRDDTLTCRACPIFSLTREFACLDTPFNTMHIHFMDIHQSYCDHDLRVMCKRCQELAYEEVSFLQDLLNKFREWKIERKEYFYAIECPEKPIGEPNSLIAVDANGEIIDTGYLITLKETFCRNSFVNPVLPLKQDSIRKIVLC